MLKGIGMDCNTDQLNGGIVRAENCRRHFTLERRMGRLACERGRVDRCALSSIFKEVGHLPMQWTEIVGQSHPDRIAPCGAARCKINLVCSWVRVPWNSI